VKKRGFIMERLLGEIFDVRSIRLDFDGKTKEAVLVELIDSIAVLNPECDRAEMFMAIMERENKMNTGITKSAVNCLKKPEFRAFLAKNL